MSPFQFRCGRNQAGIKREESVVWRCRDGSRRLRSRHGGRQTRDGCQAANRRLRISAVPLRGGTTAVAHLGTSHRRHGPGAGRKAEQTARQVSRRPRRTAPRAVRRGKVAAAARGLRWPRTRRTFWGMLMQGERNRCPLISACFLSFFLRCELLSTRLSVSSRLSPPARILSCRHRQP